MSGLETLLLSKPDTNNSVRLRELILKRFQDRGQPAGMMDYGVRVETDRMLAVVRCTNTHNANLGMSPKS